MNVGLFLPNWVGDAAMATPALRAIRKRLGCDATIVGIGRAVIGEVLAGAPWLDAFEPYDPRASDARLRGRSLVERLRRRRLDLAVLLTNSWRTAWMAWRSRAKRRIGYARGARGWLLTDRLQPLAVDGRFVPSPVLDYYLQLAYALGCAHESPALELATLADDERAADEVWRKFALDGRRVVALNTGGAFGPAKHWPLAYAAALARRLAVEQELAVLVLCGPSEREAARTTTSLARHERVVGLADEPLGIGLSKACVRRSALMVTTDTGPRHFAAAFGVPVVTLFGPTHMAWSETHYAHARHLQLPLDCAPCQQRTCPLEHHRCMRELSVDRVYQAAVEMLGETLARKAA